MNGPPAGPGHCRDRTRHPGTDDGCPNIARMYDHALGGNDNLAADREVVEKLRAVLPGLGPATWANRGFHQRAAIWMAHQGIAQFIDVGCGLPRRENTHQAVQKVIPAARVAYVDHDPMVITLAKALLPPTEDTCIILADLRDPATVLAALRLDGLIEFAQPTGLLVTAVLQFIDDVSDPGGCLAHLIAALAPGSYVALSHITADQIPPRAAAALIKAYQDAAEHLHLRTRAEVETFFSGLDLVPPRKGARPRVSWAGRWRAEDPAEAADSCSQLWWAGVGHKPPVSVPSPGEIRQAPTDAG